MKPKTVLDLLIEHEDAFISGEHIGDILHMTRANVWKEVDKLRKKGYTISSVRNRGYKLVHNANNLSRAAIRSHLQYELIKDVYCYDSVPSTNSSAKAMIPETFTNPFLVVTDHQSEGRGRKGRSFYSPTKNGIYMSLAFVPTLSLEDTQLITIIAALAVKEALYTLYQLDVDIKWLNDIYLDSKKLAGILTEGEIILESNQYRYLILGIGLNVFHDSNLPQELNEIYTSLDQHIQTDIDRNKLIATITDSFFNLYTDFPHNRKTIIHDYRSSCFIINHYIYINQDFSQRFYVKDIDEKGQLIVCDEDQNIRTLNSGEVSIQGEKNMNVKDLALSSLFSVFIIIGSMIKIPVPFVPFTLQVLAICLSALLLTRKQAVMAVLIYIIMGLIGLPVFAGGMSGPNIVMSPTFGFILGFIPMVYIINTLYHKLPKNRRFLAFVAGETILYTLALPILYFNLKTYHGIALPISKLFISYCFMFIPTDVLSMTLSAFIASRMPEHIKNKKDA